MSELENDIELDQPINGQEKVPNHVGVLVLGICSIFPGCFCYGIVGVICGIIALVMANKANKLIGDHPQRYTPESIQLVKAGKICGIIGLCLSALYFVFLLIYLLVVGSFFFSMASMGVQ
ncbi:MAG: CCC motif membrane protein [Bacteroidota bacterium]